MSNRLYVGNIQYETTDQQLRDHFASAGRVVEARIMMDRETNQSRGFGFVEMVNESMFHAALSLDGSVLNGRALRVSEAIDKSESRNRRTGPGDRHGW